MSYTELVRVLVALKLPWTIFITYWFFGDIIFKILMSIYNSVEWSELPNRFEKWFPWFLHEILMNPTILLILLSTYGLVIVTLTGYIQHIFNAVVLVLTPASVLAFFVFQLIGPGRYNVPVSGIMHKRIKRLRWGVGKKGRDWAIPNFDDIMRRRIKRMNDIDVETMFSKKYYGYEFVPKSKHFKDYIHQIPFESLSDYQMWNFVAFAAMPCLVIGLFTYFLMPELRAATFYYLRAFICFIRDIILRYSHYNTEKRSERWMFGSTIVTAFFITPIVGLLICHVLWSVILYLIVGLGVTATIKQTICLYSFLFCLFVNRLSRRIFIESLEYEDGEIDELQPHDLFISYIVTKQQKKVEEEQAKKIAAEQFKKGIIDDGTTGRKTYWARR